MCSAANAKNPVLTDMFVRASRRDLHMYFVYILHMSVVFVANATNTTDISSTMQFMALPKAKISVYHALGEIK